MRLLRLALVAKLALLLGAAGCSGRPLDPVDPLEPPPAPAPPPGPEPAHVPVRSNILRADYAGSAVCGDCHAAIHAAWQRSPMHRMTRLGDPGEIAAPFDGGVLRLGADRATMEERAGKRYVRVESPADGHHLYRVTKVIGGRQREDYVGVDVTGAADPATGDGAEQVLPVSFVHATRSWRYKGYSLVISEHSRLRPQAVWSETCIPCHNTLPQLSMRYDDLLGPLAPAVYQGTFTDNLLPATRALRLVPLDEPGLARAVT